MTILLVFFENRVEFMYTAYCVPRWPRVATTMISTIIFNKIAIKKNPLLSKIVRYFYVFFPPQVIKKNYNENQKKWTNKIQNYETRSAHLIFGSIFLV